MRKLDFDSVLMLPRPSAINSRKDVDLCVNYGAYHGVPVIVSNMDAVGTPAMARALHESKINVVLHKYVPVGEAVDLLRLNDGEYVWVSVGIQTEDLTRLKLINPTRVIIDCPNAYITKCWDFIKAVKDWKPEIFVIAGNVCTAEGCVLLCEAGANGCKIGVGNGKLCESTKVTGIGYPQFDLIRDCISVCEHYNSLLMSDGGVKEVGSICKSIGAGAHAVMCGSLFMGYRENNIDNMDLDDWGRPTSISVYGMASKKANDKYNGGLKDYRPAEGREETIPVKGSVSELARQIRGGLASACTYQGFDSVTKLRGNAKFIEI
jgi:GMP reductase